MEDIEKLLAASYTELTKLEKEVVSITQIHKDIEKLIEGNENLPKVFSEKFEMIIRLANSLGVSTKTYLDGNNTLFVDNLKGLQALIDSFETEVVRLIDTDFTSLFDDLQKVFILKTKADIEIELHKFDEKARNFLPIIDSLKKEVERLNAIDLEKQFDKHQKTLSEIFGAVNSINLTLTSITQGFSSIAQSISYIEASITSNYKETNQQIASFDKRMSDQLAQQSETSKNTIKLFDDKISSLSNQNELLKNELNTNRIIQIIGFIVIIFTIILVTFFKSNLLKLIN